MDIRERQTEDELAERGWHMSADMAEAIAEFVKNGGKVMKVPETIPVTGPEVLDYLRSCGIPAAFAPSSSISAYIYRGRHVSLRKLVDVANKHRRAKQLPPFSARV
jgi:hypothetical protein